MRPPTAKEISIASVPYVSRATGDHRRAGRQARQESGEEGEGSAAIGRDIPRDASQIEVVGKRGANPQTPPMGPGAN